MLAWIGPRPDTLVIKSETENPVPYVAEWVAKKIGRPVVGREFYGIESLHRKALDLAKMHFQGKFDPKTWTVKLDDEPWKLGAVLVDHGVSEPVVMVDTTAVKVLTRFQDDTVIVLKKEQTGSGTRITWGERVNKVVRNPWQSALRRPVVCTSRSLNTLQKVIDASVVLLPNH